MKRKLNRKKNEKDWPSDEVGALVEDLKSDIKLLSEQTSEINKNVNVLKSDVDIIKSDMELMKYALRIKVDITDFQALERRVATLESRR
jgi:polyhydroxyalkanoate synthesis regulator phasin